MPVTPSTPPASAALAATPAACARSPARRSARRFSGDPKMERTSAGGVDPALGLGAAAAAAAARLDAGPHTRLKTLQINILSSRCAAHQKAPKCPLLVIEEILQGMDTLCKGCPHPIHLPPCLNASASSSVARRAVVAAATSLAVAASLNVAAAAASLAAAAVSGGAPALM